ncbi:MAG: DUF2318 domain-containing protein [Nitrospirae bacterium]|uniref:Fe-S-containing protein n=1 Tax=Candidatus Magnetobacterium casense TaxID=1455061 RepID=UPI00058D46E6|nr:Fe-S-containing protein [Candidatus Magnetobacterium casensis]MBF0336946.1 DUF2318 domain-containing protein [Nitrospirota bacterium]
MAFVYVLVVLGLLSCESQVGHLTPTQRGAELIFDVTTLKGEVPKFYTYRYQGKKINFFVIKVDGRVMSFLDACKSCYQRKLGFEFHDGYFMCRSCKTSYSVHEIEKGISNCMPVKIDGRRQGDDYRISVSTLEGMAYMF